MSLSHIFSLLFSFLLLSISHAQYTEVINSNRPSRSMGAFSVGKNVYQWEQGISFRHGEFDAFYDASFIGVGSRMQLRAGLFKEQLEVLGTMDYQVDKLSYQNASGNVNITRNAIRNLSLGIKYLVYDPFIKTEKYKPNLYSYHANNRVRWRDLLPAVSIFAGAQFSAGGIYPFQENFHPLYALNYRPITEPTVSVSGMLILQQHLKPGLVLVHNIGMRYITATISQKQLIGTLTYSSRSKLSFYGEYQVDDSVLYSDLTLSAGAAYLLTNDLQLDLALSQSMKTSPKLLTTGIGVSYRLDKHNKWAEEPQNKEVLKQERKKQREDKKKGNSAKNAEKRTKKGLRKLTKKQKRIERKLNKIR